MVLPAARRPCRRHRRQGQDPAFSTINPCVYADFGGQISYEAALMAVEDFGGKVLGVRSSGDRRPSEQARHRLQHCEAMVRTPSRSTASWS
ncbi:hypothetical protein F2981_04150 [Sinorhizobium meliloti]|nr:hypothetical protein [Sinorhizobium meliloti]